MSRMISVATLALLAFAGCSKSHLLSNPDKAAGTTPAPATLASSDADTQIKHAQDFVNAAGQAGLLEIQASKLALDHSKNQDVKMFAQTMIAQHTEAAEGLKAAAAAAALAPPPEALDDAHTRTISDLTAKPDDEFDAAYTHMQIDAHNDAIQLFRDYAASGVTPQVKTFAEQTLPALEQHKDKALALNSALLGKTPHPS